MEFFIPEAKDNAQAERVYAATKEHLSQGLGAVFTDKRYFSIRYEHNGEEHDAEVGKPHYINREPVIAILYDRKFNLFHVCTPNRGVLRDMSILVGADGVRKAVLFDGQEPDDEDEDAG
jgi:hypothetical protein